MRSPRRFLSTIALLLVAALATGALPAAAREAVVSNTFIGSGAPVIGPASGVQGCAAAALGYRYTATGTAVGDVPGPFTYVETGCVTLGPPAPGSTTPTVVMMQYLSGVFTLHPNGKPGNAITLTDEARACYQTGVVVNGVQMPIPTGAASSCPRPRLLTGQPPHGGVNSLAYGYFTFGSEGQLVTGYATPTFERFIITIPFAAPEKDKDKDKGR